MNICITGSSGFAGRNIVSYFEKLKLNLKLLTRHELQTITSSKLEDCDVVIHLAGKAHDLKKVSYPKDYYDVNYELTKKLYDSFLHSNAKKFIFVSSVKAAADSVEGVLTENMIPDPKTDYGKSKLMAEQYIQSQQLPDDKSYYILRPCMIHGPGNKGNLNLLYNFVKKGIPYPLAGFDNLRSFLSIENLCFIISQLIEKNNIASGIYQVADDKPLSTNDVIKILSASLNKKPKLWSLSPGLIRFIAKIGNTLYLPLTTERLDKLTESYVVSNSKIKQAIAKELPLTADDGLKFTALSFSSDKS
ncbi:NAD-dependent epimerase/dehydratase family protein [Mucilaginibacter sp. KACC 22063]|uniref:NAD-dependent epimerase/dehydratase family protein n=1 Tax=Mucilaginibacter sp. KACC 22063 TaxID=3025666 RepID=UPI0023655E0E|nr:NAD-dependent epimerase/dehydratase family protein [Mucilaginibacter sp. KACC 22063]WDF54717.1 NAD-dependent epimerase/dehydratase family protein [Mucilaginibacter sp. KACC 22063]